MKMVSPTWTSRPALASCPFTVTRPASHVSLASVRRRITRLHFKKRSRRIRSIYRRLFNFGNFLRSLGCTGIGIALGDLHESLRAEFREVIFDLGLKGFLPQDILNFLLGELEGEDASVVFIVQLYDHEGTLDRNNVGHLPFFQLSNDFFKRRR